MELRIGPHRMELVQGDITDQKVDAIINAANASLAGGGGVDGAIHRGGGPSIMEETNRRYPEGCPTGRAVMTDAGELPCRKVIHAVGPIWSGGDTDEQSLLASAYRTSLELAVAEGCHSIAMPALSAGAYGYPLPEAARVAVETVRDFLSQSDEGPLLVRFVLFGKEAYRAFQDALAQIR